MVELSLSEREQDALRTIAASEPVPGSPFPTARVLEAIADVVPADRVAVGLANASGFVEDFVELGGPSRLDQERQVCDGPLLVGLVHVSRLPEAAPDLRPWGLVDGIWLGYRNGTSHVVQLALARTSRPFRARDLAVVRLMAPSLRRVMRERPTPQLPTALTIQERRILMRVAAGHSNAEIAESLCVASCTVRKHLENAYRKLGVSNRVAAVARLQGRDAGDLDLRARLERFAQPTAGRWRQPSGPTASSTTARTAPERTNSTAASISGDR